MHRTTGSFRSKKRHKSPCEINELDSVSKVQPRSTLGRFAEVVRLGPYAPPLRSIIQELKYHRHEGMLGRMGELLAEALTARTDAAKLDAVIPVPMHWRTVPGRAALVARFAPDSLACGVEQT